MAARNTFQNNCAKDVLSAMLARHGKTGKKHDIRAVVLDYPVIEQWTGGCSYIGMCLQIPSYFYKPTGRGAYTCASYETLKSADINLDDFYHDSDDQGPAWWKDFGNKYLKKLLFTADIFAYGGKHTSCFELWMIDGEHLITEDMTNELISWHYSSHPYNKVNTDYSYIDVNCISSEFILSQDKNMDPSAFMQLCRDNCVKKVPEYKPQVVSGVMDIRGFFKRLKPLQEVIHSS